MVPALTDAILRHALAAERESVQLARARYFALTGEIYEDDWFYEERVRAFQEWFVFDHRLADGRTPLARFAAETGAGLPPVEREVLTAMLAARHSLFQLKGRRRGNLLVRDLIAAGEATVIERRQMVGIDKRQLFEARLIPHQGAWIFTDAFCVHPAGATRAIQAALKTLFDRGEPVEAGLYLMNLARLRLMLERYRGSPVERIYAPAALIPPAADR